MFHAIVSRRPPAIRRRALASALLYCAAAWLALALTATPLLADDSDELVLTQWRVAGVAPMDAGRVELRLTASLQNVGSGTWSGALARPTELPPYVDAPDDLLEFDAIAPFATVAAIGELVFELPRADVRRFLRQVLIGAAPFRISGTDVTVYARDTAFVDPETDAAFITGGDVGANVQLEFDSLTPLLAALAPGQVLMEDQAPGGYRTSYIIPTLLPGQVVAVRTVGNTVEVELAPVTLVDLIESGTVSTGVVWTPPTEHTIGSASYLEYVDGCEDESHLPDDGGLGEPVECASAALPLRFNDVDLGGGVTLSGQVLLRSSGVTLDVRMRDGAPHKITAAMNFGWTVSARLQAERDVVLDPEEQRLWGLTLPTYTVSLGGFPITLTPDLEMLIGAQADMHAGATVSVNQSGTVGVEIGWQDGEYFAEPIAAVAAPAFSPPRLTDDTRANGKLWAALDIALTVNGTAGPVMRTSLFGDLFVSPVRDPWWVLGAGMEQTAGFQLSLLGIEIARWDAPVYTERFASESGARPPLQPVDGAPGRGGELQLPSAGEAVRWALALTDGAGSGLVQDADVVALADGSTVVYGANTTAGFLVKLDATGTVLWEQELPQNTEPRRVIEASDGGLMVAGDRIGTQWFARHEADGSLGWVVSRDVAADCRIFDFVAFENDLGAPAYLLAGRETTGGRDSREVCAVRLDQDGNVVWANVYAVPADDAAYAVVASSDGNFVLAGETVQSVNGTVSKNGLLMKITPDGELLWAKAFASVLAASFETVVELGNGTLLAAGGVLGVIKDDYPALWVVNVDQDGNVINQALLAQDVEWEDFVDAGSDAAAPPWEETSGGDTPYDVARAAAVVPGGVVLSGSTGLGNAAAMWAIKLNESLGVTWMTTFDGGLQDQLHGVAFTGDGIVVSGLSTSFVPLGVGGESAVFAAKLPQEGLLDFAAAAAGSSRFVQPEVYQNGLLDAFGAGEPTADVSFAVLPAAVGAASAPPLAPVEVVSTVTPLTE
jgi:hypothetical protein